MASKTKTSFLKHPAGARREPFQWHEIEGLQVKGCVNHESASRIASRLSKANLVDEDRRFLASALAEMQGPFALYFENEDIVFAATDRIRSFPFAYKARGGFDFRCSLGFQDIGDIDSDSVSELLGFGYVTGSASASRRWQQLLAGQYMVFHKHISKVEVRDYYLYPFSSREEARKLPLGSLRAERALSDLDSVHLQIIDRLIEDLAGRQVVVALSGGYDSRLIVELLSRRNYENAVCFTYGNRDDAQARKAAKIAEHCGFRWLFIPYDESMWKRMFASEEFRRYQEWCTQFVSIPHIADWPAVKFLTENTLIDPGAIIVSGMSGDFLEGRHIPTGALAESAWSVEKVADGLMREHFVHYPPSRLNVAQIRNKVNKEVSSLYQTTKEWGADHENMALALSYAWEWRNRQAKYTCNSVRVYEWHGHEWRLPLWDNVLMDFWAVVPVHWQKDRWLYREYVKRFSTLPGVQSTDDETLGKKINSSIRGTLLRTIVRSCGLPRMYSKARRVFRLMYADHMKVSGGFSRTFFMRIFGPARGTYEYLFRAFTYRGWGSYVCLDYVETLFSRANRPFKEWLRKEAG